MKAANAPALVSGLVRPEVIVGAMYTYDEYVGVHYFECRCLD